MRTILLTILLLAAAAPAHGAVSRRDGAVVEPGGTRAASPARPLSPALRASVMTQCQKAFPGEGICACVVYQLEVLSPDPEVVTSEALQTAFQRCRKE